MGGDSTDEFVPEHVPALRTNKVLVSGPAAADMLRPTVPMPPLFDDAAPADALGAHADPDAHAPELPRVVPLPPTSTRASAPSLEAIEVPAPQHVDDGATAPTRSASTSLGVAPLEPATVIRAPFVIRTSISAGRSRTAMVALDAQTGLPRGGMWSSLASAVARRVRTVRWWVERRRRTQRVRRLAR